MTKVHYDYSELRQKLKEIDEKNISALSAFVNSEDITTKVIKEADTSTPGKQLGLALGLSLYESSGLKKSMEELQQLSWNIAKLNKKQNKFLLDLIDKIELARFKRDYNEEMVLHTFLLTCLHELGGITNPNRRTV
jgi:hypothetical protein